MEAYFAAGHVEEWYDGAIGGGVEIIGDAFDAGSYVGESEAARAVAYGRFGAVLCRHVLISAVADSGGIHI